MSTVYLNGEYLPKDQAFVSVDDRGFLFGDGIYEVTSAYDGRLFRIDRHVARMRAGLAALSLQADAESLVDVQRRLIEENGLSAGMAYVYVQITRGRAPRGHAFPTEPVTPTVYAFARSFVRPERSRWDEGFGAVTVPDRRWARVDIKTVNLLANCLAQQEAAKAGVPDALFVRDGVAIEGGHSNFFAVFDGTVVTHPTTNAILPGITREWVLESCGRLGIDLELRPIMVEELAGADEAFFTGTTTEIRPTVQVDGVPIGGGRVGPVVTRLYEAFLAETSGAGSLTGQAVG